jgi:hypothetical protein
MSDDGQTLTKRHRTEGQEEEEGHSGAPDEIGHVVGESEPEAAVAATAGGEKEYTPEEEALLMQQCTNRAPRYPYLANFNDHFETSSEALRHLVPALRALQEATKPTNADSFFLYDPYYCEGSVVAKWAALGFPNMHHECRDFYEDVKNNFVPEYDILVTNPPYSADHIPRLMDILVTKRKPFALLVPDYVAKKPFYTDIVARVFTPSTLFAKPGVLKKNDPSGPPTMSMATLSRSVDFSSHPLLRGLMAASGAGGTAVAAVPAPYVPPQAPGTASPSAAAETVDAKGKRKRPRYAARKAAAKEPLGTEPFYIVPKQWYDFEHPKGAGHAHSHFRSMWIVWGGPRHAEVLLAARAAHAATAKTDRAVNVFSGLLELEHRGSVEIQVNRPNPTQRLKTPRR